ncbi:sensor histidine kinase [Cellulomonas wangsupingiae]|uniref:sensor histidine kinase n=1 Tax=Cellulomonas wangsupingiae TaxID=2968085 RepID=UPI001D0F3A9D|nr:ATP-binding protein [Cellulomonas wangsupingiae]MCM0639444.1 hypothetical protein [Cellulomonas wangsupingiae]
MTGHPPRVDRGATDTDEQDLLVRLVVLGITMLAVSSAVDVLPWTIDDIVSLGRGVAEPPEETTTLRLLALAFGGMTVAGAVAAAVLQRVPVLRRPLWQRVVLVVALGAMIGVARIGAVALGLPARMPPVFGVVETVVGASQAAVVIGAAMYFVGTRRRIRAEERLRIRETLRAERARRQLEQEELRVRREVSHRLHGGLQQRMVLVNREIEEIRDDLARAGETDLARSLTELSATLDDIRESEVRAVAHQLYPLAADVDLPSALLLAADRLPPSVRMHVTYEPGAESLYVGRRLPAADRMLLYLIVEEGTSNAVRHGDAENIWVTLGTDGGDGPHEPDAARVRVDDDGSGLTDDPPRLSGLAALRTRVLARDGDLTLLPGPRGGARLTARLPLAVRVDDRRRP